MKKIILGFFVLFITSFVSGFLYIYTNDIKIYLLVIAAVIFTITYQWRELKKKMF